MPSFDLTRTKDAVVPFWAVLLAASALFLVLGVLGARTDTWRDDEAYTYDFATHNAASSIPGLVREDHHPPLFYQAMSLWLERRAAPQGMKVLTMAFGLASLLAASLAARLVGGRRLGALTALLWATFPMLLHYSQDARMYSMALCLETIGVLGWALAARRPAAGWMLFVLGLSAALFTHNLCLVFAAALIALELVRSVVARREPAGRRGTGPVWILTASGAIALLYLPWAPTLWHQMHLESLSEIYRAARWIEVLQQTFIYPYTLFMFGGGWTWVWLPGIVMLAAIPLAWLVGCVRRTAREAGVAVWLPAGALAWMRRPRPHELVTLAGLGAFVALILYSGFGKPVFLTSRQGLLFLPFVLFSTAAWFAAQADRPRWRLGTLGVVAACGGLAVAALAQPRDFDRRDQIDQVLQKSPIGPPIFIYPGVPRFVNLWWDPVPLYEYMAAPELPAELPDCTLVIVPGQGEDREEIKQHAKLTVGRAAEVREILVTHEMSIYGLKGLPPGELRDLIGRMPGKGINIIEERVGPWKPELVWRADQLAGWCRPKGELTGLSSINPDWRGMRLSRKHTKLRLPLGEAGEARERGYRVVQLGGRYIARDLAMTSLRIQWGPGPKTTSILAPGNFAVMQIIDGAASTLEVNLRLRDGVAEGGHAPEGDVADGMYLVWGGLLRLTPERFARPGFEGGYFDVGALGDQLYIREGFHESEGMPPDEVRWTTDEFALQLPVWPGRAVREVVLAGMMPPSIKDRRLSLRISGGRGVDENDAGAEVSPEQRAEIRIESTQYGEAVFTLAEPLAPGIYALRFKIPGGAPSPKDLGQGPDPRPLGFYLSAVGLR